MPWLPCAFGVDVALASHASTTLNWTKNSKRTFEWVLSASDRDRDISLRFRYGVYFCYIKILHIDVDCVKSKS